MPSPFPGMNPYLETDDSWHTFHKTFCTECLRSLAPQVEPAYIVQSDENIYIHELPENDDRQTPAAVDVLKEPYLAVREEKTREVVTVVEFLSPTNKKAGPDRAQYLAKWWRYLNSNVNLVEIDLLRGGERMPLEELPDCDYCVAVSRVEERPKVAIWPLRLRDALPAVPIPLRPGEPEAMLDLQPLLHRVYDDLRFANYIYRNQPQPPLHPQDTAWARKVIDGSAP